MGKEQSAVVVWLVEVVVLKSILSRLRSNGPNGWYLGMAVPKSYGLYRYGLYRYGLGMARPKSYGLHSYGLGMAKAKELWPT